MIELSDYTYFMITAKLIVLGFKFHNENLNNTEEWINPTTGRIFKIKKSSSFYSEDDLLNIINQAGISFEAFLRI